MEAVLVLKDTMAKVLTSLESIRDPERFAEKMHKYATSEDPTWKSLVARIEAGDTTSHLESQQYLLNQEIGDGKLDVGVSKGIVHAHALACLRL